MKDCDACDVGNKRPAVFRVVHSGGGFHNLCTKHASKVVSGPNTHVEVLEPEFPPLPPSERDTERPAPALEPKHLTASDLDELERFARMTAPLGDGVQVDGAQLLELVLSHRCMLAFGELVREFKGPRP